MVDRITKSLKEHKYQYVSVKHNHIITISINLWVLQLINSINLLVNHFITKLIPLGSLGLPFRCPPWGSRCQEVAMISVLLNMDCRVRQSRATVGLQINAPLLLSRLPDSFLLINPKTQSAVPCHVRCGCHVRCPCDVRCHGKELVSWIVR